MRRIELDQPWSWLAAGWRDLCRAPRVSLAYGVLFALAGSMVPAADRGVFSLRLILHGRAVCVARRPRCHECVLADFCPSAGTG